MQKQRALVENEQLRIELESCRHRSVEHESLQATFTEAESESHKHTNALIQQTQTKTHGSFTRRESPSNRDALQ